MQSEGEASKAVSCGRLSRRDTTRSQPAFSAAANRDRNWSRWLAVRGLCVFAGVAGLCALYASFSSAALAGPASRPHPTISADQTTFNIPAGSSATWTLRLWTHTRLIGESSNTSGVLSVAVPPGSGCQFQADVNVRPLGRRPHFYSGNRATVSGCGTQSPSSSPTVVPVSPVPATSPSSAPPVLTGARVTSTAPSSASAPSQLASTGVDAWPPLLLGLLLLGLGTLLFFCSRAQRLHYRNAAPIDAMVILDCSS